MSYRRTGVLSETDRLQEAWITIGNREVSGAVVTINARLGYHFRLRLTESITLEAPYEPASGQRVVIRLEQDATGGRVITLGAGWVSRGSIILGTGASTVAFLEGLYDDESGLWEAYGIPSLTSLYDAAGAAAAALVTAEAYTDTAIAALSTVYAAKTHASTHLAGGADQVFALGAAIADATDAGSAITQLNLVLARARAGTIAKIAT